jgi:hypothetical protein
MTTHLDPDPTPPHGTPRPLPTFVSACGTFRTVVQPCETSDGWTVVTTNSRTGEIMDLPHINSATRFTCYDTALSVAVALVDVFDSAVEWGSFSASDTDTPSAFGGALDR